IWSVQTASFRARLLDDTSCTDTTVPACFSSDRTQVHLKVPKALFNNPDLVADPNVFQYFCQVVVWKSNSPTNYSFYVLDQAPDQTGDGFVLGTWSSTSNTAYGCQ